MSTCQTNPVLPFPFGSSTDPGVLEITPQEHLRAWVAPSAQGGALLCTACAECGGRREVLLRDVPETAAVDRARTVEVLGPDVAGAYRDAFSKFSNEHAGCAHLGLVPPLLPDSGWDLPGNVPAAVDDLIQNEMDNWFGYADLDTSVCEAVAIVRRPDGAIEARGWSLVDDTGNIPWYCAFGWPHTVKSHAANTRAELLAVVVGARTSSNAGPGTPTTKVGRMAVITESVVIQADLPSCPAGKAWEAENIVWSPVAYPHVLLDGHFARLA